jgi:hypothetical protein
MGYLWTVIFPTVGKVCCKWLLLFLFVWTCWKVVGFLLFWTGFFQRLESLKKELLA